MKANELRINNWVLHGGVIQFVESINNTSTGMADCCLSEHDNGCRDIKPIPLTEEWLIKFGFEVEKKIGNRDRFNVYKKGCLTFNTSHQRWWLSGIHSPFNPKYVHQLQNLYHSLTGGLELEIIKN